MNVCKRIVLLLLSFASEALTRPGENEDMMLLRRRMDSDKAASYAYRIDNNGPAQVYYLSGDDLNRNVHHYSLPLVYYDSKPVTYAPKYYHQPKPKIITPVFKPSPVDLAKDVSSSSSSSSEESDEKSIGPFGRLHNSGENIGFEHFGRHFDNSGSHESLEGDGSSHEDKYLKKKGKKDSEGYNKESSFHKGRKGSYEKELDSGDYGEDKKSHDSKYHDSDKYHEHKDEAHHKKGGKFDAKKHHKKGSKSKGYHNVFMKDEYKKDHTFYDTADHHGKFSKHGSDHKKHHDEEGEKKKGGHYESSSDEGHHSEKGGTRKGSYDQDDQGYKKKSGNSKKYSHHEKYAKHGAQDHHSDHGSHH